jgi:Transposase DDE domain
VLATEHGQAFYRQRQINIEPVFGQIKFNRAIKRFQRGGRIACRSEWRFIAASHNVLKLHHHRLAAATPWPRRPPPAAARCRRVHPRADPITPPSDLPDSVPGRPRPPLRSESRSRARAALPRALR